MRKIIATTALLASIACTAQADENNTNRFYVGFEGGINKPLSDEIKFKAQGEKMTFSLKQSNMYSARLGYVFAPGMAVELSYTKQPKFKVGFKLPSYDLMVPVPTPIGAIPTPGKLIPGTTKAVADVYTINMVYDLMPLPGGITPYFIGGAGIAKIDLKPTQLVLSIPSIAQVPDTEVFSVQRSKGNYFAWQAGLGAQKEITSNLSFDVSAKLQAIHNIKLRYTVSKPGSPAKKDYVKKTLGGIELGAGLTFKF